MNDNRDVKHYLVSIFGNREVAHMYVISDERRKIDRANSIFMEKLEDAGFLVSIPVILLTILDDGVARVREIVCELSPDKGELMKRAVNFHTSGFVTPTNDPLCDELLEMH